MIPYPPKRYLGAVYLPVTRKCVYSTTTFGSERIRCSSDNYSDKGAQTCGAYHRLGAVEDYLNDGDASRCQCGCFEIANAEA